MIWVYLVVRWMFRRSPSRCRRSSAPMLKVRVRTQPGPLRPGAQWSVVPTARGVRVELR